MTSLADWCEVFQYPAEDGHPCLQRDQVVKSLVEDFGMSVDDASAEISKAIGREWLVQRDEGLSLIADSATAEVSPEASEERIYPAGLRKRAQWLLWTSNKVPRAPWVASDMYPCRWNGDLVEEERPETSFETAVKWAQHEVVEHLPTNLDDINREDIELGYLLPHEVPSTKEVIIFIDFDAVRIPETEEIHPVVSDIVSRLDSFTEISQSGTGLHVFVYGRLPDWLTSLDAPIADEVFVPGLDKAPHIELYQQGRWVAVTGRHLPETPTDIREAQETLDEIIAEFQSDDHSAAQILEHQTASRQVQTKRPSTTKDQSPYYSHSVTHVAQTAGAQLASAGREFRSDHPAHGGSNGTNFAVSADDRLWRCYSSGHEGAGGNSLHLVATIEGFLECEDCAGIHPLDQLSDETFARLCLIARDTYGFSGSPPYRAVVGIARHFELIEADHEILGDIYSIARTLYDSTSFSELE